MDPVERLGLTRELRRELLRELRRINAKEAGVTATAVG